MKWPKLRKKEQLDVGIILKPQEQINDIQTNDFVLTRRPKRTPREDLKRMTREWSGAKPNQEVYEKIGSEGDQAYEERTQNLGIPNPMHEASQAAFALKWKETLRKQLLKLMRVTKPPESE